MKRWTILALVMLVLSSLVSAAGGAEDDSLALFQEKLAQVNVLISDMIGRLSDGGYASLSEWTTDQEAIRDALAEALGAVPDVLGVPFAVWFQQLCGLNEALDQAEDEADANWPETQTIVTLMADAAVAKDHLEAQLREANEIQACAQGSALLEFYVGLLGHDLESAIHEASAKGQCIDAIVRQPESTPTSGMSSTELMARDTIAAMGRTDVRFVGAETADNGTYMETYVLGDPSITPRTPSSPTQPEAHFVDAALAHSVTSGVPDRLVTSETLDPGDPLTGWFKLSNVCGSLDWEWHLFDPDGYPVGTYSGIVAGPATGCYDNYSSSYPLQIEGPAFWMPGEYSAELWLDSQHSYQTAFNMNGLPPQDPYASNDVLRTPADTVLGLLGVRVLENDADPNGDRLSAQIVRQPAHGQVHTNPDESIGSYEPEPGFVGVDTFTYLATDGMFNSLPATVQIYVGCKPPYAEWN